MEMNPFFLGTGAGVAADHAYMTYRRVNQRSRWAEGLTAGALLIQFLGGQQVAVQAAAAQSAAISANLRDFTSGGGGVALGVEVGRLRGDIVRLGNAVALGLSNMSPMVSLGLQAQQAPLAIPVETAAAGTTALTAQTTNLAGILLLGLLLYALSP